MQQPERWQEIISQNRKHISSYKYFASHFVEKNMYYLFDKPIQFCFIVAIFLLSCTLYFLTRHRPRTHRINTLPGAHFHVEYLLLIRHNYFIICKNEMNNDGCVEGSMKCEQGYIM